jgi:pimeloyl-ACP methyl ester carboxylesterase
MTVTGTGETTQASVWTPVPVPPQAPAHEAVAELPGTRLWYWDTGGTGRPVVLMHAATHSAAGWVYQQPVLAQAGYRAIAYSRRGYYRSDPGDPANPGFAADDLDNLLQHLNVSSVDLVAAAHGGFFALDFALAYPTKVRSLTIVSSLMGVTDADYEAVNNRLRPANFTSLPHEFRELSPSYRAGNPDGVAAWLDLHHQALQGDRLNPRAKQPLTWARLETIRRPTLLLTGESDLYTPPSLLRMQALHMPHAEVATIPESGHSPYWEQPIVFNRLVLDFLARH